MSLKNPPLLPLTWDDNDDENCDYDGGDNDDNYDDGGDYDDNYDDIGDYDNYDNYDDGGDNHNPLPHQEKRGPSSRHRVQL